MPLETVLDKVLDAKSKTKIVRLFMLRTDEFMASGREIARMAALSPPAAHKTLKALLDANILKREIIGRQHIYSLNAGNRTVRELLRPAFIKERSFKADIKSFLLKRIHRLQSRNRIVSAILYGSLIAGRTHEASDCDIAIVVTDSKAKTELEKVFGEHLAAEFHKEFGVHLDSYVKTFKEFRRRLLKNQPPVSTLMMSHEIIYGKDPLDFN